MIENLVFGPGAIYGYCLIGAVKYLEEYNHLKNIKSVMGISVGSFLALFVALKFKYNQMKHFIMNVNLTGIIDYNNNFMDIIENYGYDDGKKLLRVTKIIVKNVLNNENATLQDLYNYSNIELCIVGSNISKSKGVIFNYKTYPDMPIYKAILISCCIPLIYKPVTFEGDIYVDGALNSCSSDYYKDQKKTLRIMIDDYTQENGEFSNFYEYLLILISYPLRKMRIDSCNGNTIYIVIQNFRDRFMDTELTDDDKLNLIEQGYQNLKDKFIDFENFVKSKKIYVDNSTQTDFLNDNQNDNDNNKQKEN